MMQFWRHVAGLASTLVLVDIGFGGMLAIANTRSDSLLSDLALLAVVIVVPVVAVSICRLCVRGTLPTLMYLLIALLLVYVVPGIVRTTVQAPSSRNPEMVAWGVYGAVIYIAIQLLAGAIVGIPISSYVLRRFLK